MASLPSSAKATGAAAAGNATTDGGTAASKPKLLRGMSKRSVTSASAASSVSSVEESPAVPGSPSASRASGPDPPTLALEDGRTEEEKAAIESKRAKDLFSNKATLAASSSTSLRLESILRYQFGEAVGGSSAEAEEMGGDAARTKFSQKLPDNFSQVFKTQNKKICAWERGSALVEHAGFTAVFMVLTLYALFVPDIDVIVGSKASQLYLSIVTTVALCLFFIETLLLSVFKQGYFLRHYFWLDVVALLSLLPDTYIMQELVASNAFVAGRSSRFTRILRMVARSSKATRLNRISRMVRLAAALPRMLSFIRRKTSLKDSDIENLLDKKLRRIFAFIDEDMDGQINENVMDVFMQQLTKHKPQRARRSFSSMLGRRFSTASSAALCLTPSDATSVPPVSPSSAMVSPRTPASAASPEAPRISPDFQSPPLSERDEEAPSPSHPKSKGVTFREEDLVAAQSSTKNDSKKLMQEATSEASSSFAVSEASSSFAAVSEAQDVEQIVQADRSPTRSVTRNSEFSIFVEPDAVGVKFDEFKEQVLADEWVRKRLYNACQQQMMKNANLQALGVKHMEDVGVKVALGVLVLLLILSFLRPAVPASPAKLVVKQLDLQARMRYGNWANDTLPPRLQEQFVLWRDKSSTQFADSAPLANIVYLDLSKRIVCSDLAKDRGLHCDRPPSVPWIWPPRGSLAEIDKALRASDIRTIDVDYIFEPEVDEWQTTPMEELDDSTKAVAILDNRGSVVQEGWTSLMTTTLVLVIMFAGIITITRDLSTLSKSLLKPIRSLADEMASIAQMQLAGLQQDSGSTYDKGVAEVRLIQNIFMNTKTAIRSWGKYVPWPVVQLLLAAGIDAQAGVEEKVVTMFFSDIASFTTIVEKLPPERSLLLLSRYFNDMSTVIDSQHGIVIEFIGDAILAVFGAPVKIKDHQEACVKATLRMLRALDRINTWSSARQLPKVSIRCGIHTGEVLVGNMGFHSRMKYGVVGENSNLPARLEELNKTYGTNNLMSEATFSRLAPGAFVVRPIDYIHLRKAERQSELVYQVLGRTPTDGTPHRMEGFCDSYMQALEDYRNRDFELAAASFDKVYNKMQKTLGVQDEACKVLSKRAKFYASNPPPDTWDGVWDQHTEPG
eukprot:TRINITY_DN89012_c0_g1_i1.p1 TRINITY_DN89012_c0_g1~~TRINITY_DN89012_c0_g1_i1.p1  ORF type:complete len:1129 (-),score=228.47 TRINITY_DN89012_c0_g1_i1:134-3520(-)